MQNPLAAISSSLGHVENESVIVLLSARSKYQNQRHCHICWMSEHSTSISAFISIVVSLFSCRFPRLFPNCPIAPSPHRPTADCPTAMTISRVFVTSVMHVCLSSHIFMTLHSVTVCERKIQMRMRVCACFLFKRNQIKEPSKLAGPSPSG